MINGEKLFENFFDDRLIINQRLYNFSTDTFGKITAANGSHDYDDLLALLTPLITDFGIEIGEVDTAISQQLGKTQTNDQVMTAFKLVMSEKEGVIANTVGGFNSAAYLEFYPHMLGEYSKATKTQMPLLTSRIFTAADKYHAALGAPLTTLLQGFKQQWIESRADQEEQKGSVSDNRTDRSEKRTALELGLCKVIHTIAAKFPGNVEQCMSFFSFNLLFNQTHHETRIKNVIIPAGGIAVVLNETLTDTMGLNIQNTDDNAPAFAYLAATADAAPSGTGKKVNPQKGIRPKPSQLGNLDNTFLLIKNLSTVNDGSCVVKIKG